MTLPDSFRAELERIRDLATLKDLLDIGGPQMGGVIDRIMVDIAGLSNSTALMGLAFAAGACIAHAGTQISAFEREHGVPLEAEDRIEIHVTILRRIVQLLESIPEHKGTPYVPPTS